MTGEEAIKILHGAIKKPNAKDGYLGQALDMAIQALEQRPCDDAISREAALEAILTRLPDFCDDAGGNLIGRNQTASAIRNLPSVKPTRKTGKWKLVQVGKHVDLCCANCGTVRVEEIAYNYTIDQLNKFFKKDYKDLLKHPDMSYCPCCGIKMENEDEVKE